MWLNLFPLIQILKKSTPKQLTALLENLFPNEGLHTAWQLLPAVNIYNTLQLPDWDLALEWHPFNDEWCSHLSFLINLNVEGTEKCFGSKEIFISTSSLLFVCFSSVRLAVTRYCRVQVMQTQHPREQTQAPFLNVSAPWFIWALSKGFEFVSPWILTVSLGEADI